MTKKKEAYENEIWMTSIICRHNYQEELDKISITLWVMIFSQQASKLKIIEHRSFAQAKNIF